MQLRGEPPATLKYIYFVLEFSFFFLVSLVKHWEDCWYVNSDLMAQIRQYLNQNRRDLPKNRFSQNFTNLMAIFLGVSDSDIDGTSSSPMSSLLLKSPDAHSPAPGSLGPRRSPNLAHHLCCSLGLYTPFI
jgi:hypothetical protein